MKKTTLIFSILIFFTVNVTSAFADRRGYRRNVTVNRNVTVVQRGGYGHHHHNDVGTAVAAGITGLAVGAMIGAARSPRPSTVVVQQPVVVQQVVVAPPAYGTSVYVLPGGCSSSNVNGIQYYKCGGIYHQPVMGSNGVYYQVVPPPF